MKRSSPKYQRLYLKILWGYPEESAVLSQLEEFIEIGNSCFEIIDTPGHCDDHICLYSSELRIAFTGDVFCGTRVKYLRADEDFNKQLETIRKLANLEIETICCSVSGIVPNGGTQLKNKLLFMEETKHQVVSFHNQGCSGIEIRNRVLGKEGIITWFSNGHFSKLNMVKSILNQ